MQQLMEAMDLAIHKWVYDRNNVRTILVVAVVSYLCKCDTENTRLLYNIA